MNTHLFICLPILNESANLPKLISSLISQSYSNFSLIACINQPNDWWNDQTKIPQCIDNAAGLDFLSEIKEIDTTIIDKSTKGEGWIAKKRGVGWARKLTMDMAAQKGKPTDIIISIDADTHYPSGYFQSVVDIFKNQPTILAHSNPYYHPLSGKKKEDEAILRYEIYMRIYALNMLLINNPYAFSAIGSGMACTVKEYIRLDGMTPKHSGEDFYFIQKMCKSGRISNYNHIKIYPQARFSDRVNFGTGPAMIKGDAGDWSSYPFYTPELFAKVAETYQSFDLLFEKDIETPMTNFLKKQLKREHVWAPLRKNFKKKELFVNACIQLVDGLRILQFLKESHTRTSQGDKADFKKNMMYLFNHTNMKTMISKDDLIGELLSFEKMMLFRDVLVELEYKYRALMISE